MSELCLVTGGGGFIGSHLVDGLVRKGHTVRVLDDFSTDPAAVAKAVREARVVFHLGALASVARSVETPLVSHAACATGTVTVLDEARKAGVKRVVYAASSSAYGGYSTQDGQTEALLPNAMSPYAAAKLAGEYYMQAFAATYGLETVRLRFFNIFGPRQRADSPYSGVIAIFTAIMQKGTAPTVHGDGLQSRDFTYVANCVQAIMKAAEAKGVSGNVYNVGTGSSVTVLELVAALNKLMRTDLTPKHADPRAGDVRYSKADISRTRKDLGYEPTLTFEQGLAKTLAWYRGEKWD
jgi:UDP-glucose 4-epimerase